MTLRSASVLLLALTSTATLVAQTAQRGPLSDLQDARRALELHRDQPLRRCRSRFSTWSIARRRWCTSPRSGTRSKDARCLSRWSARSPTPGPPPPRQRAAARVHPGQHPRRRSRGQGSGAGAGARHRPRRACRLAGLDGAAGQSDLQRRRQRARVADQPRPAARADRRPGHASQRAGAQHQPRQHQARHARGAIHGAAAQRLRPARHARPAHDQRLAPRLPPDLRDAEQPRGRSRHRRSCRASGWRGDQAHQVAQRLGLPQPTAMCRARRRSASGGLWKICRATPTTTGASGTASAS